MPLFKTSPGLALGGVGHSAICKCEKAAFSLLQAVTPRPVVKRKRKCKLRTLIPTSEELASLNLQDGKNQITFSFTTRVWGKQEVSSSAPLLSLFF